MQPGGNFGNGTNNNTFNYVDVKGNTYTRRVNAAYNVITFDQQSGTLAPDGQSYYGISGSSEGLEAFLGARLPGSRGGGDRASVSWALDTLEHNACLEDVDVQCSNVQWSPT